MEDKKEIKVTHFAHWSRSGITSLIKTIAENCHGSFSFVLLESDQSFNEFYNGIKTKIELNFSKSIFRAARKYVSLIKKEAPDLIHIHSLTPLLIATLLTPRYKKIFHLHCDYPYLIRKDFKSALKRQAMAFCLKRRNCTTVSVSETSKNTLQNISKVEVRYIANGVPDSGLARASFLTQKKGNRFYSVCRLDKEKNIIEAVNLLNTLLRSGIDAYYDIYGAGVEYTNIENHIKAIGADSRIKMMGFSNTPECLPANYDFYISTSTQEGLSLSALHALRGNTPLITTPVGQIGLVIQDGHDGFILQGSFVENLEKLNMIVSLPDQKLLELQKRGRELYLSSYTIESFLMSIEKLYKTVVMKR